MLSSVLIANRGEIACRIARTARRMGLRVIAVYSEADRDSLHVSLADEAHLIGPAPARESYLDAGRIIDAARKAKAACIHPGYGFLSENAAFAEMAEQAGIVFVGPPPAAIRAMGLKDAAKNIMTKAGVPVVPGYAGDKQGAAYLAARAGEIGFPVMIKAVAGGGGKGMRHVSRSEDFAAALDACRREAASAFGDDRVLIEKFIAEPRHIEIQVLADGHGNCVHLFERDCSLQRRHQKVIEEAPAPGMTDRLRQSMGNAAVAGAKAVGYRGAGTVEFILGAKHGLDSAPFYFMEMNTRLQVEHPVTELVTGLDLVEQQFRVAAGEKLAFTQDKFKLSGHAIEARLYAEDPETGFLPQSGRLLALRWPEEEIRIDTGVRQGDQVTPYYDPMIAKLIAKGSTRQEAIERLRRALGETLVLGLRTNKHFLAALLDHPSFQSGEISTAFIDRHLKGLTDTSERTVVRDAAVAAWLGQQTQTARPGDVWSELGSWSLAGTPRKDFRHVTIDGEPARIEIAHAGGDQHVAYMIAGRHQALPAAASANRAIAVDPATGTAFIDVDGLQVEIAPDDPLARDAALGSGGTVTRAPMAGKVIRVMVELGQKVAAGETLIILEAMKMEHALKAGVNGTVTQLSARTGAQVADRDVLCVLEELSP